jgi:arylsulfatase A-like enzyme
MLRPPRHLLSRLVRMLGAAFFLSATSLATTKPPNIVFILADDLGWSDLGCQGSAYYETPHIDRLAETGMRLDAYYHCQNCQPTRAALMTGQHGARTGVYTVGGIDRFDWSGRPLRPVDNVAQLPIDLSILPQPLKEAGYATGLFGKWHLGESGDHHPARRGFDEAIVSSGSHFRFNTNPPVDYPEGSYLADFLTDLAEDFIGRHKDGPFFLYLPHFGVHSPYQAKDDLTAAFKAKEPSGGHRDPVYAAMIASVDGSVGRVVAKLETLGLADDTVVIFSSDNGGVGGYGREGLTGSRDVTDNAPLRHGKGSLYEGGIRVPFIVSWPGVTTPGAVCAEPAQHVDILPTIIEIAGARAPDQIQDGLSLVPVFRDPSARLGREAVFQHFPGYLGSGKDQWRTTPVGVVHSGGFKLMEFFEDGRLELYNLKEDIGETRNLAVSQPEKAAELHARMKAWREAVNAPMPATNEGSVPTKREGKGKAKAKGGKGGKGKAED